MLLNWYKIAIENITNPENAINTIKSLGYPNPLNQHQTIINDVKVEISPYDDNVIWLKCIMSINPKKGKGTMVLKDIINIANNNNVAIYLDPKPSGTITQEKLNEWYKNNGFVQGRGDFKNGLIHYPNKKT